MSTLGPGGASDGGRRHAGDAGSAGDLDALLAAYAVGALEEPDRTEVEALLARSPAAAARAADLQDAAAAWGGVHPVEAPPALRARVMAALDDVEQLPPLPAHASAPVAEPVSEPPAGPVAGPVPGASVVSLAGRRRGVRPLALVAAAAAVLLAGGTGWQLLRDEPARQVASGPEQVTGAPDAVTLQPAGAAGAWTGARLVHSPSQGRAVLTAEDPLREAGDQVYVLWTIDEYGGVRPADSFSGGSGPVAQAAVDGAVTLAVTLEPRAGGAAPTTDVLARYQLT